ncbi:MULTISPECIES: RNA-binding S4 domain-containing protein [Komagataeibacter]|uniref:Heat shock protein n=2 Tax=Komagataeibacter TaxID=1434011 RepID=A0A0D6Q518_KOMXY|nr:MULTISPECIES: S4 domain-containing protein [Komagataeibacter]MBL7233036.1 RNA-binding protein [Komagataeibacter oboediens]MBT0673858.1 RNA-binding protein [Komagataeibacter oboediens]MBT0677419.1 RNA-binding protein [Komagataeibacter oboediens]MBV1823765.1 RNA-binding protein [Komagataeibacter oboediens]GAN98423.1 heat shock protein [Komagataeibacter xylinus NBRC 13693]
MTQTPDPIVNQRLDLWLLHARFGRSRSICAKIATGGQVRINRQRVTKAHAQVHVGDILTLPAPDRKTVMVIRVVGCAERRQSAPLAQLLYEIVPETV